MTAAVADDEIERLGERAFEREVRPVLKPEDDGKFVAIAVDSGDFEIDADDYTAVMRLRSRHPAGEFWLMRAGSPAAYKFAGTR